MKGVWLLSEIEGLSSFETHPVRAIFRDMKLSF